MGRIQDYISKQITGHTRAELTALSKKKPPSQSVIEQIIHRQLTRERQDIQKWRNAMDDAERDTSPDRTELIRTYKDVRLDNHLSALIDTRKNKVLGKKFKVVDANGDEDEKATMLLEKDWFFRYMSFALDSLFYGYEVIEFGPIINDEFQWVEKVREEFVVPERSIIKKELGLNGEEEQLDDRSIVHFMERPWSNWVVWIGDPFDLGLLSKVSPMALWKKNVLGAWSERAEIFGMPIRIGKTLIRDNARRLNMDKMLTNMGSAAWATLDKDDDIIFAESSRVDAHKVYDNLIERTNTEMSKIIIGGTATVDEKSFVGSAQVQERNLIDFSTADSRKLKFNIENQLFRIMRTHRLLSEQPRFFVWDSDEKLNKKQELEIIIGLSNAGFKPNREEVEEKFNVKLDEPEANPFGDLESEETDETVVPSVAAMYKPYFNKPEKSNV